MNNGRTTGSQSLLREVITRLIALTGGLERQAGPLVVRTECDVFRGSSRLGDVQSLRAMPGGKQE